MCPPQSFQAARNNVFLNFTTNWSYVGRVALPASDLFGGTKWINKGFLDSAKIPVIFSTTFRYFVIYKSFALLPNAYCPSRFHSSYSISANISAGAHSSPLLWTMYCTVVYKQVFKLFCLKRVKQEHWTRSVCARNFPLSLRVTLSGAARTSDAAISRSWRIAERQPMTSADCHVTNTILNQFHEGQLHQLKSWK